MKIAMLLILGIVFMTVGLVSLIFFGKIILGVFGLCVGICCTSIFANEIGM